MHFGLIAAGPGFLVRSVGPGLLTHLSWKRPYPYYLRVDVHVQLPFVRGDGCLLIGRIMMHVPEESASVSRQFAVLGECFTAPTNNVKRRFVFLA